MPSALPATSKGGTTSRPSGQAAAMADQKPRRPSEAASSSAAAEEKKLLEEKRYPIIPRDSIKLIGKEMGCGEISDAVAAGLSEDVSYHIREVIMKACQPMRHSHRKQLTTEDINKALKMMRVEPVLGYGSQEPMVFQQSKDSDAEENEVDLFQVATASITPVLVEKPIVKGSWIAIEGNPSANKGEGSQTPSKQLPEELKEYYDTMTTALMEHDEDCKKFVLNDLRTNHNISPLVPYFTSFVCNGVKRMNHEVTGLVTLLQTIRALINNDSVFIFPALKPLVEALQYCALEPLAVFINPHNDNDHWMVRDMAARILADIIRRFDEPHLSLRASTIKAFTAVMKDMGRPMCTFYGAIMGLQALGPSAVEDVLLPQLSVIMPPLETMMKDSTFTNRLHRSDAIRVFGAMKLAAEMVLKNRLEIFKHSLTSKESDAESTDDEDAAVMLPPISFQHPAEWESTAEPMETDADGMPILAPAAPVVAGENGDGGDQGRKSLSDVELYRELNEYFGDSLNMCVPEQISLSGVFLPQPREDTVILGDADSNKTGEELLAEFMEQVRLQEAAEAAEREREAEMQRKREEEERLRRIQQEEEERRAQEQREREEAELRRRMEMEKQRRETTRSRRRESRLSQQHSASASDPSAGASSSSTRYGGHHERYYHDNDSKSDDDEEEEEEEEEDEEEEEEEQQHSLVASQVTETRLKIKIKQPRHPRIKMHLKQVAGWADSPGQQHSRGERHRSETRELREEKHHEYRDTRESRDAYDYERREHRESKHKRKRHSPKSHDPFDFEKSDSDEHHSKKGKTSLSQIYSPAGESSESDSAPYSRLKIKLKVPNKDSPKE